MTTKELAEKLHSMAHNIDSSKCGCESLLQAELDITCMKCKRAHAHFCKECYQGELTSALEEANVKICSCRDVNADDSIMHIRMNGSAWYECPKCHKQQTGEDELKKARAEAYEQCAKIALEEDDANMEDYCGSSIAEKIRQAAKEIK